jgi:hypothetical protein
MIYNEHNLAVAKIASKDERRPAITGVYFMKDKSVATDSFRLLEVSVSDKDRVESFNKLMKVRSQPSALMGFKPFIVPAKAVKEIKIKKNSSSLLSIEEYAGVKHVDNKKVEFITTGEGGADIKVMARIDDKFPDYEGIFPAGSVKPEAEILINAELLAELLAVMGKINDKREVKIKIYGPEKPVVLEVKGEGQKGRGMIMPIREN